MFFLSLTDPPVSQYYPWVSIPISCSILIGDWLISLLGQYNQVIVKLLATAHFYGGRGVSQPHPLPPSPPLLCFINCCSFLLSLLNLVVTVRDAASRLPNGEGTRLDVRINFCVNVYCLLACSLCAYPTPCMQMVHNSTGLFCKSNEHAQSCTGDDRKTPFSTY